MCPFRYFWSLQICNWICFMFSVMMARSSSYAIVLHVVRNVLMWYHRLSFLAIGGVDLKYNE